MPRTEKARAEQLEAFKTGLALAFHRYAFTVLSSEDLSEHSMIKLLVERHTDDRQSYLKYQAILGLPTKSQLDLSDETLYYQEEQRYGR